MIFRTVGFADHAAEPPDDTVEDFAGGFSGKSDCQNIFRFDSVIEQLYETRCQSKSFTGSRRSGNDVESLEDVLVAAVNEAIKKVESVNSEEMNKIAGGINIPGVL